MVFKSALQYSKTVLQKSGIKILCFSNIRAMCIGNANNIALTDEI
jgi:hypothetical protein